MRTKDWKAVVTPKTLLITDHSTLQWSEEPAAYTLFLDYYFQEMPYDHGERSRYTEAKNIFEQIKYLSAGRYRPQEIYATNLCPDPLERAPKGKHPLVTENKAAAGLRHIRSILKEHSSIEAVFAFGLQTNYLLQRLGFYGGDETFLYGAQPRRDGVENAPPYYRPVRAAVFAEICGNIFETPGERVKTIPLLGPRDYPLEGSNREKYAGAYERIRSYFEKENGAVKTF